MKVFISWSGGKSKVVAETLRDWIPNIIQSVKPWMSKVDIEAGQRWNRKISQELEDTKFGIICLTRENLLAPWIQFETGALAKTIDDETFVCPYLIDLEPPDIPQGPLTQFQAKRADEKETFDLILAINSASKALKENHLSESKIKITFDKWWPDLKKKLHELPSDINGEESGRTEKEMIEEILELVRDVSRRSQGTFGTQPWEGGLALPDKWTNLGDEGSVVVFGGQGGPRGVYQHIADMSRGSQKNYLRDYLLNKSKAQLDQSEEPKADENNDKEED